VRIYAYSAFTDFVHSVNVLEHPKSPSRARGGLPDSSVPDRLGQMRPFDYRNSAGQADDLTAWGITVGDWADYRLFSGLHMMTVG